MLNFFCLRFSILFVDTNLFCWCINKKRMQKMFSIQMSNILNIPKLLNSCSIYSFRKLFLRFKFASHHGVPFNSPLFSHHHTVLLLIIALKYMLKCPFVRQAARCVIIMEFVFHRSCCSNTYVSSNEGHNR